MTNEPITIEFANRLSDHLAAQRLYYKSTLGWKMDKAVAVLLTAFGSVLVVRVGVRWWSLIWFPLGLAEWLNLLSIHGLRTRIAFKSNPKFRETYRLTFSDEGVHFKTTSIDSKIAWTHYTGTLEDGTVILLIYGRWMYTVIPKTAFDDRAQLTAFTNLVNQYVGVAGCRPTQACSGRADARR